MIVSVSSDTSPFLIWKWGCAGQAAALPFLSASLPRFPFQQLLVWLMHWCWRANPDDQDHDQDQGSAHPNSHGPSNHTFFPPPPPPSPVVNSLFFPLLPPCPPETQVFSLCSYPSPTGKQQTPDRKQETRDPAAYKTRPWWRITSTAPQLQLQRQSPHLHICAMPACTSVPTSL